jgi:hypothetical protein
LAAQPLEDGQLVAELGSLAGNKVSVYARLCSALECRDGFVT